MDENLPPSREFSPVPLRTGLLIVLLASTAAVFSAVTWIYHRVHNNLGQEIAEVVMAFVVILILGLIIAGFVMGCGAKWVFGQRQDQAESVYQLFKWCKIFQSFWVYLGPQAEREGEIHPVQENVVEIMMLPNRPARRGRPPTYSIDRWTKVVFAWENRDPWRDPITLDEFLSEEFGTYADGSPRISRKTYYDWRKKVYDQARNQRSAGNKVAS
jgi:hypothetical protein